MVVPQGKKGLRRGKDRGKQLVSGALRINTLIDQICCLIWARFMVPQNNYSTSIKDHYNKYNHDKHYEILYNYQNGTQNEQMLLGKWWCQ